MKIGRSQNIKELKEIIQTLSKTIPMEEEATYNKLSSDKNALSFLNKRLKDMMPKRRQVIYNIDTNLQYGTVDDWKIIKVDFTLNSYGRWGNDYYNNEFGGEYYTDSSDYQYKQAFVNTHSFYLSANSTDVDEYSVNGIYIATLNENNTNNWTEVYGFIPCQVVYDNNNNKFVLGIICFSSNRINLICDDWSFLTSVDKKLEIKTNPGIVHYYSYEDYTPKTT